MSSHLQSFSFPCQVPQFLLPLLRYLVLKLLLSWLFSEGVQVIRSSWSCMISLQIVLTVFDELLFVTCHLVMLRQGVWCASCSPEKLRGSVCQWAQTKDSMHDSSRAPMSPSGGHTESCSGEWLRAACCLVELLPVLPAWDIGLSFVPVVLFGQINVGLPCTPSRNSDSAYSLPNGRVILPSPCLRPSQALFRSYRTHHDLNL